MAKSIFFYKDTNVYLNKEIFFCAGRMGLEPMLEFKAHQVNSLDLSPLRKPTNVNFYAYFYRRYEILTVLSSTS